MVFKILFFLKVGNKRDEPHKIASADCLKSSQTLVQREGICMEMRGT